MAQSQAIPQHATVSNPQAIMRPKSIFMQAVKNDAFRESTTEMFRESTNEMFKEEKLSSLSP
jgi:hypothetical protein